MSKTVALLLVLVFLTASFVFNGELALASTKMQDQTFGGPHDDVLSAMVHTSDGGYALLGITNYNSSYKECLLVKTDSSGDMEWNKTIELLNQDYLGNLIQTSDGGYALAGHKDFAIYGEHYSMGGKGHDFWLVKTDAHGTIEWNRTYGGSAHDSASTLVETSDGGYALAGYTWSFEPEGFWLVKTDKSGNMEWSQAYGGDVARELVETSDGGYALAGTAWFGIGNCWLVKTDEYGIMEWNMTYGEDEHADWVNSLIETSNGGFALAGRSTTGYFSTVYSWFIKTDVYGNTEWMQKYTGGKFGSLIETSDGGFALAGDKLVGNGNYDFWLIKTDASGIMEWNQTYGGEAYDGASSLVEASSGGFALAGVTYSFGAGGTDFWLIRTEDKTPPTISISSPVHKVYNDSTVQLIFSIIEPASSMSYSMDGRDNVTISGNTTLSELPNGPHNITVYVIDDFGNIGASETICFTVEVPFPTTLVIASVITVAVACVGLILYFKKRKHYAQ
jgi:hypothetical protein